MLVPASSVLGYASGIKERRAHRRRPVNEDAQVIIPSENLTLPCRVINISIGGAAIECDVIPHADTKINLVMKDGRVFEAVTAWFENGQLGLRFLGLGQRTQSKPGHPND
jgi:hypothetical protein